MHIKRVQSRDMIRLSYKYRLKPSTEQIPVLEEQLHLCRWVYNTLLEHSFNERKAGRGTPTHKALTYLLPEMKTLKPELDKVFSQVLQNVAKRVRSGFEGYWARRRAGLKAHLPRFRGADKYGSLTYPQFGFRLEDDGLLCLSKIGDLKLKLHRPIEGKVKTLTVARSRVGKWYAVFACEDFSYKTARSIVNRYERIYLEDLKIQNMQRNRCVSKSIADAGWGLLRNALTYMARLSEGVTAFVDPRGTSQICSGCGVRVEKGLGERMHRCPVCGLVLDRDVNAARNILKCGLEIGREPPEYTPVGEAAATHLSGDVQATSMKQEAHDLSHG
jgi:IS605 OrfB family transposase